MHFLEAELNTKIFLMKTDMGFRHFCVIKIQNVFSQTVLHSGYERVMDWGHVYKPVVGAASQTACVKLGNLLHLV
jgi:hypothetical protein